MKEKQLHCFTRTGILTDPIFCDSSPCCKILGVLLITKKDVEKFDVTAMDKVNKLAFYI